MEQDDFDQAAALLDFVELYLEDERLGAVHPAKDYMKRFPGHETAVRAEYARLCRDPTVTSDDGDSVFAWSPWTAGQIVRLEGPDQQVDRYLVEGELGRGGQATVYRARDMAQGRRVALKVLAFRWDEQMALRRKRFRREMRLLGSLDHPGLCGVYRAYLERDPPCLALHLVEGRSMADLLAARRADRLRTTPAADEDSLAALCAPATVADLSRLLLVIEQVARALHAAHEAGVIHRDVKPANIMVDEDEAPVVLDFGLARSEDRIDQTLTRSGEAFGTPAYMSPEQVIGPGSRLDRRADVFSLGVTLFECLTLERPFEGDSRRRVEDAICNEAPRDPRRYYPGLPHDLEVVLKNALEKERNRRYATALELAEELRRVRCSEPIRARPPRSTTLLLQWARRNPWLATACTALLLTLSCGLAISLWLLAQNRAARVQVVARTLAAEAAAALSEHPDQALELALQSLEQEPGPGARTTLLAALMGSDLESVLGLPEAAVTAIAAGRGASLAVAHDDGHWLLWDLQARVPIAGGDHGARIGLLAFAGGGQLLITGGDDATLAVWDVASGELLARHVLPAKPLALAGEAADLGLVVRDADGGLAMTPDGITAPRPFGRLTGAAGPLLLGPQRSWVLAATGSRVVLFDPAKGHSRDLFGAAAVVNDLAVSPAGTLVAAACDDGFVIVWDLPQGRLLQRLPHADRVRRVIFDPSGSRLLACGDPGAPARGAPGAVLWDANSGERLAELAGHDGRLVNDAAFSPDGELLATVGYDGAMRLWSAEQGELLATRRPNAVRLYRVSWTEDGTRVVARDVDSAWVWRPLRGTLGPSSGHTGPVLDVEFSRDGKLLLSAGADGTLRCWNASDGQRLQVLSEHQDRVTRIVMSPVDDWAASASEDGSVRTWWFDERGLRPRSSLSLEGAAATALALAAETSVLACGDDRGALRIWADGLRQGLRRLPDLRAAVTSLCFSPDGRKLVAGDAAGTVRLYDLGDRGTSWDLRDLGAKQADASGQRIFSVSVAADGPTLLACSEDGVVRRWSLAGDEPVSQPPLASRSTVLDRILVRPASPVLVQILRWRGVVKTTSLETGTLLQTSAPHSARILDACLSSGGDLLMTASLDGSASLQRLPELQLDFALHGHEGFVLCCAISPDGQHLATGGADGTVRLWPRDPLAAARSRRPLQLAQRAADFLASRP